MAKINNISMKVGASQPYMKMPKLMRKQGMASSITAKAASVESPMKLSYKMSSKPKTKKLYAPRTASKRSLRVGY